MRAPMKRDDAYGTLEPIDRNTSGRDAKVILVLTLLVFSLTALTLLAVLIRFLRL